MKLRSFVLAMFLLTMGWMPCVRGADGAVAPASESSVPEPSTNPLLDIDFRWRFERAQAQRLFNDKKYEQAEAAFRTLADTAPRPLQKARCLAYAAMAVGHQAGEERYEAAMALAGTIDHAAWKGYATVVIQSTHERFDELIARFKDADIAAWPEEIADTAFHLRGRAYIEKDNLASGLADYEAAWARVPQRDRLWPSLANAIGWTYRKLDQDEKALQAYRKALAVYDGDVHWKGGSYHGRTMLAAAEVLREQGRDQEALDVLTRHEIPSKSVAFHVLAAAGDVYAALGRTEEAIAAYRKAIAHNEKYEQHEDYNESLRKKIAGLR